MNQMGTVLVRWRSSVSQWWRAGGQARDPLLNMPKEAQSQRVLRFLRSAWRRP
ncbi:MAG: hypothetical protein ACK46L_12140 [Synechococcaceae cyanobacterium]